MLMAICRSDEKGWERVDDLSTVSDLREAGDALVWAECDVGGLSTGDIGTIAEEFELSPLAVEDSVNLRQRPKIETYATHLFVVFHQLDEIQGQLEAIQIACFVGDRYVLTVHGGATRTLDEAKRRWQEAQLDHRDPVHLLHTLLDVVVDDYQAIADRLEEEMEELEELVLEVPEVPIQRQLYSLKQRLSRLRRYVLPGARLLDWVVDPDSSKPFKPETAELFRDIHDHLLRITDEVRNVDELAQAVLDLTRAEQADTLNEVNKKLSAWAAIFAVGTLIAGIYGMNFRLVPRDQTLLGFWFAVGLMAALGVGLYVYFKRRKWM